MTSKSISVFISMILFAGGERVSYRDSKLEK